jgi:DNA segregation ATPase FtsK/SpoIIIE, S-DNA-T family
MRTIRRSSSSLDNLSEALREFLKRRAVELVGLGFVVLAAAAATALATWSVNDPSFNHATRGPVRNALHYPGAVFADLAMQIFGLGAIAILIPLALWGWRLMRTRRLEKLHLRFALWVVGSGAATAVASALPPTTRWPLPSGLGGVAGDAILGGARTLAGLSGRPGAAILGFVFAALAILSLTAACGFGFTDDTADADVKEDEAPAEDDDESARDDEPGWGMVLLGWIGHAFMSLKAWLIRRLAARRAAINDGLPPVQARAGRSRVRQEPSFDEPEDDAQEDGDDEAEDEAPRRGSAAAKAKRVVHRTDEEEEEEEYDLPSLTLLAEPKKSSAPSVSDEALEQNANMLESTLEDFGVKGEILNVHPGPVVTLYELEPAPGTKSSRVISLADDIARSMSAVSARVAVVQGRNAIGIELPNQKRETVYLRELLDSEEFEEAKQKLALCLGKTIGGEPIIVDLAKMPHLLVAGTTGSGKSVAINTMILSLLYRLTPEECRLIMVDPKMLELSVYEGIPHLLTPVVTDPKKAVVALKWAVREMEERYKKMSKVGVRNIDGFNARVAEANEKGEVITRTVQTGFDRETGEAIYEDEVMDLEPLPYIVVIVDEMADLMMVAGKDIEGAIQRLAQMARAAGIHVILATQRPSVDVITGTIKANFPTRISFQVTSKIDSRTILGEMGAEQLLGQGDMLYMAGGGRITRVHGPFVSDGEVEKVVAHLKKQGRPSYLDAVTSEESEEGGGDTPVFDQGEFGSGSGDLYDQAVAVVLRDKKASTSYIQRRLQIGYNRAASLMERMEKEGIVGAANHAGKREILVETADEED